MRAILQCMQPHLVNQPTVVPCFRPATSCCPFCTFVVCPDNNFPATQQFLKCGQSHRNCQNLQGGNLPVPRPTPTRHHSNKKGGSSPVISGREFFQNLIAWHTICIVTHPIHKHYSSAPSHSTHSRKTILPSNTANLDDFPAASTNKCAKGASDCVQNRSSTMSSIRT